MSWAALLVPFVFIALGAYMLRQSLRTGTWPRAQGVVTGREFWKTDYYPVVSFKTPDGRAWSFRDKVGLPRLSGMGRRGVIDTPAPGTVVAVAYDPARPENARIASGSRLWTIPVVLLVSGVVVLLFVIAAIVNGGPLGT